MKIIILIMTVFLLQVSATTNAQISLNAKQESLRKVLKSISKQSGYDFVYTDQDLNKAKPVDLKLNNASIENALKACFEGQPLVYEVSDRTVMVKEKEPSFLDNLVARFTDIDVRGRVVDEQGNPLPNASIQVNGKAKVYNSNEKGEFVIANVPDDGVLVIRYVGYKQLEIALKDAVMPLEIKLNVATGELEEVKVVYSTGYQNIPKERATGSFVQIDNQLLNRTVGPNILERILSVTSSLRDEGSGLGDSRLSIRGFSTINANKMPLIVVDGFAYNEGSGSEDFIRLDRLNPNDVESVTILRDAAAASIWGARSANGVIVITTKKGSFSQKSNVQFSSNVRIIEKPDLSNLKIISSADAIEFEKKLFATMAFNIYDDVYPSINNFPVISPVIEILLARRRNVITQTEADRQLEQLSRHDIREDVSKYMLKGAVNQQYNLNVGGGTDKTKYYVSVGYDRNPSNTIGNESNRLTLRLDNTYKPIKNLELSTYISYNRSKLINNGIDFAPYLGNERTNVAPYSMLVGADGSSMHVPQVGFLRTAYLDTIKTKGLLDWHYRPIEEINNSDNTNNQFNTRFGGGLKYTIIQGLSAEVNAQYDYTIGNIENYYSLKTFFTRNQINKFMFIGSGGQPQYPIPLGGILDYTIQKQSAYDLRGKLTFNRTYGKHNVSALAGIDVRESQYDSNSSRKYGYNPSTLSVAGNMSYNTSFVIRPIGSSFIADGNSLYGTLNRFISYYSNLGYTLLNKYTITGSARIDASNFFGVKANLKSVPLWSTGVSWDIKKENFFQSDMLSTLKIRATYGINGNLNNTATALPTINYNPNYYSTNQYNNNQEYAERKSPPNPGLTWEKSQITNLAIDFGFLGDRFSGSIDVYFKKGRNLIGPLLTDPTVGVLDYTGNYANIKSNGIDLILNGLILKNQFKWNTNWSVSYNNNEVTDYYVDPTTISDGTRIVNGALTTGKVLSPIYSYKWAGLNALNGDPMGVVNGQIVSFKTVLGYSNGVANTKPEDLVYHGSSVPKIFGNVINSFSFKGITASFNITYGFNFFFRATSIDYNKLQSNWGGHSDYALRWQKPGDELITNVPSIPSFADNRYAFYSLSQVLIQKGDNVRLKDLRLSYDVNKHIIKVFPFNNASVFVNVTNLGILWRANSKGLDPRYNNRPAESRTISFGLTLNL